jgi:glutathione S-transferase
MLRLHYHPMSPYSRKAWAALRHREDAFEPVPINLGEGALRRPEFLAISPFGKMPVLETDDGPIVESTSIIEYVEARGPRVLVPDDGEAAFAARHYDRLADHYLMAPMAELWWSPKSEGAQAAPGIATTAWEMFARRLEGRAFVAGERFTLGDLGAAIASDYLARLGVSPPPAIRAWMERCFAIPALRDTLAEALPAVEATLSRRAARTNGSDGA